MKRTPKPFAVEIKKSRVPGQRTYLPPKPLFGILATEVTKTFCTEEPQATAQPVAAPRILPSIVEPLWSDPEPSKPVRRKPSSGAKPRAEQIGFELNLTASHEGKKASEEASVHSEQVPQTDLVTGEDAVAVHEAQPSDFEGAKPKPRKPRIKSQGGKQGKVLVVAPEPEQTSAKEAMESPLDATSGKAGHRRLVRRQAAAARLPRSERWKRRLPPATW